MDERGQGQPDGGGANGATNAAGDGAGGDMQFNFENNLS